MFSYDEIIISDWIEKILSLISFCNPFPTENDIRVTSIPIETEIVEIFIIRDEILNLFLFLDNFLYI